MKHQDRTTRIRTVGRYLLSKERYTNKELLAMISLLDEIRYESSWISLRVAQNIQEKEGPSLSARVMKSLLFAKAVLGGTLLYSLPLPLSSCVSTQTTAEGMTVTVETLPEQGSDLFGGKVHPSGSEEDWRPGSGR